MLISIREILDFPHVIRNSILSKLLQYWWPTVRRYLKLSLHVASLICVVNMDSATPCRKYDKFICGRCVNIYSFLYCLVNTRTESKEKHALQFAVKI
jgi:hypothetical protein